VCVRCGQTEEFESAAVLKAGERAAGSHGFRLLECVLNVRALCPRCAAAKLPHTVCPACGWYKDRQVVEVG